MSVGYGLLKSVLHNGTDAFVALIDTGITVDSFHKDEKKVFSTIESFYLAYGTLPTIETITVDSGITVPWGNLPIEPVQYWTDLVKERTVLFTASGFLTQAQNAIGSRDLHTLRESIQQAYISLEQSRDNRSFKSIADASTEAILTHNQLQQSSSAITGIPFAFPYLNLITGGASGGDIISWISRPGLCKSYLLLNEARLAHNSGKKVLFVSMEMPIEQCARRLLSLRTRVNYTRLRLGTVSTSGIQILEADILRMSDQVPFQILSGGIFGTIDRIQAQIKHYRPDVVYIDGAYLVRTQTKGGQRWEKALQVLETLKSTAMLEDIPICITYQYSKSAPNTLEGIGTTDGLAQLSSLAISIEMEGTDESMWRSLQYRKLKILKGRDGAAGSIRIELNFNSMRFRQESILSGAEEMEDFEYDTNEQGLINETDNEPVSFI